MQSKLVIATLAAMSDITSAISTTASDSAQESANAAATLIGYYDSCNITVENLEMTFKTLEGVQKTVLAFEFAGRDESCPELTSEIWLEVPVDHTFELATE